MKCSKTRSNGHIFANLLCLVCGVVMALLITLPSPTYNPEFLKIAGDFAKSHAVSTMYSTSYNCVNYSTELVQTLNKAGYESKVVTGFYSKEYCKTFDYKRTTAPLESLYDNNCTMGHSWVEVTVQIDPMTGKVVK